MFFILGSKFEGLNQKSAMISICELNIYIGSESFSQNLWKNVGEVGFLVIDTWA